MCGRFALPLDPGELVRVFLVDEFVDAAPPSWNIAPSREISVVLQDGEKRFLTTLKWGLVPAWARKKESFRPLINARSETIREKPSFKQAFSRRRCIIPASGFFEWDRKESPALPWYFSLRDNLPMALAGIYEEKEGEGGTCAIITTDANGPVSRVHHRMPVILSPEAAGTWLLEPDPSLLVPLPDDSMQAWPVSREVNSPANDTPSCIDPVG
jgi:putative SOS response-associated peptidase YedK